MVLFDCTINHWSIITVIKSKQADLIINRKCTSIFYVCIQYTLYFLFAYVIKQIVHCIMLSNKRIFLKLSISLNLLRNVDELIEQVINRKYIYLFI